MITHNIMILWKNKKTSILFGRKKMSYLELCPHSVNILSGAMPIFSEIWIELCPHSMNIEVRGIVCFLQKTVFIVYHQNYFFFRT